MNALHVLLLLGPLLEEQELLTILRTVDRRAAIGQSVPAACSKHGGCATPHQPWEMDVTRGFHVMFLLQDLGPG